MWFFETTRVGGIEINFLQIFFSRITHGGQLLSCPPSFSHWGGGCLSYGLRGGRRECICIFTHFRRRQNGSQTQTQYSDPKFIWTVSCGQIDEACDDGNVQYDYLKQKNESQMGYFGTAQCSLSGFHGEYEIYCLPPTPLYGPQLPTISLVGRGR